MGFFKTKKEKEESKKKKEKSKAEIQRRSESRRKALNEQNKKNKEIRNLYRERIIEEISLREKRDLKN